MVMMVGSLDVATKGILTGRTLFQVGHVCRVSKGSLFLWRWHPSVFCLTIENWQMMSLRQWLVSCLISWRLKLVRRPHSPQTWPVTSYWLPEHLQVQVTQPKAKGMGIMKEMERFLGTGLGHWGCPQDTGSSAGRVVTQLSAEKRWLQSSWNVRRCHRWAPTMLVSGYDVNMLGWVKSGLSSELQGAVSPKMWF